MGGQIWWCGLVSLHLQDTLQGKHMIYCSESFRHKLERSHFKSENIPPPPLSLVSEDHGAEEVYVVLCVIIITTVCINVKSLYYLFRFI